jgi:hypothetical protein
MKVKATQRENIRITLTPDEAGFLLNILMNGISWEASGDTGTFAESLHLHLGEQPNVVESGDAVVVPE